jgi:hypothetical protein
MGHPQIQSHNQSPINHANGLANRPINKVRHDIIVRRYPTMKKDGRVEIQHYVPQLLSRLHVNDPSARKGTEQVWCFDKMTDKVFSPNIKGILASSRFYEVEIDTGVVSLEASLTKLEDRVTPILARLIRTRKLGEISTDERQTVAEFCAVQFIRTQAFRERIRDLNEGVANAQQKRGIEPSQVSNFKTLSEEEIKTFSLQMLSKAPQTYGPHFLNKHWFLIEGKIEDPFHLGDHPVVVDNDFARDKRGGMGLASPGVSIYLPLCPTLCLGMTDPLVVSKLFEGERKINTNYKKLEKKISRRGFTAKGIAVLGQLKEDRDRVNEHINPLKEGTPTAYNHEVVTRVNSLQMLYATRWIISLQPDFSLPKRMIADSEKFREGPKLEVE